MNKNMIIKKNEEIKNIVQTGIKKVTNYFIIYNKDNGLKHNRYCISISKKVGNAVVRNYQKRVIKEILRKNDINLSKDYVIILRKELLVLSYSQKEENLVNILRGENK